MKVRLDLPDWVDERHVRVHQSDDDIQIKGGIELVAIKRAQDDFWLIKDGRCNMCGDCCTGLDNHIYPTINGDCIHLDKPDPSGKRICKLSTYRSRICDNDPPEGKYKRCTITYRKVPCK